MMAIYPNTSPNLTKNGLLSIVIGDRAQHSRRGLTLGRLRRLLVKPAERLLGGNASVSNFPADIEWCDFTRPAFYLDDGLNRLARAGILRTRALRIASAASATPVFSAWRALRIAAAWTAPGIASTTASALASSGILFFLVVNAITRRKGDFELVQLVPLFLGTLIVGNGQQSLHAATWRGGVLFGHFGIIH